MYIYMIYLVSVLIGVNIGKVEWYQNNASPQVILKAFFFVSYFWCQTSSVSPRAPDPVRILSDPGWFSTWDINWTSDTKSKKNIQIQN